MRDDRLPTHGVADPDDRRLPDAELLRAAEFASSAGANADIEHTDDGTTLQNDAGYTVTVVAHDTYGNVSNPSSPITAPPVPSSDFYEHYREAGGSALGANGLAGAALTATTAYFASYGGSVYAVNRFTGRLRWRTAVQGPRGNSVPFYSTPALAGGRLVVGGNDGSVYALDARSGAQKWRYDAGGYVYASAAIWHHNTVAPVFIPPNEGSPGGRGGCRRTAGPPPAVTGAPPSAGGHAARTDGRPLAPGIPSWPGSASASALADGNRWVTDPTGRAIRSP